MTSNTEDTAPATSPACPEKPELLTGQPIGQYHCPSCGEMLIAGLPHPEYDADTDAAFDDFLRTDPDAQDAMKAQWAERMENAASPTTAVTDAREREAAIAFEKWWATKVAEGYQYGRGPLATVRFGFEAGFAASLPVVQSTPTAPTQDATALCTPIRCGTNPALPPERVGCGQYITSEIDLYRCVDCSTPFHRECLRSHFGEHKAP